MPQVDMLINAVPGEECRIAIVRDGRLEELYHERTSAESQVGNIYKGRVMNVEPAIQAAFIDFGRDRNGFLHISDLHPMYFPGAAHDEAERVGMRTPRRERPPIQKCLHRGQEVLVQVLKSGIGTKGPTLSTYLSIPGRFLVMMPNMERLGVSRKIEDDELRRKMRQMLDELNPPKEFGFIIRTAGIDRTKAELKRDLAYLQRLWRTIDRRMKQCDIGELYTESNLVIRTIRDVFTNDIQRVIVDNPQAAKRAADFLAIASPRSSSKVFLYKDPIPLFDRFDIERQIENIHSKQVPLPSGGSLVIESTEALVAIDVNSGRMRDNHDAETTAFKTDMEAADEICRQLRLRDLGGVVVNDLIDMRDPKHRRAIEQRFRDNLKRDRARTRVLTISQFGILEMTRQRMRPGITSSVYGSCPHCGGAGKAKTADSVVLDVMRRLAVVLCDSEVARVEVAVSPDVAFQLLNRRRASLVALEEQHGKSVLVRVNSAGPVDFVGIQAFDSRGGVVEISNRRDWAPPTLEPVGSDAVEDPEDLSETSATRSPASAEEARETSQSQETQAQIPLPPAVAPQPPRPAPAPAEGQRRRRRGRGRSHASAQATGPQASAVPVPPALTQAAAPPAPTVNPPVQPNVPPTGAAAPTNGSKRRRRRRGGRGRGKMAASTTPHPAGSPAPAQPPEDRPKPKPPMVSRGYHRNPNNLNPPRAS